MLGLLVTSVPALGGLMALAMAGFVLSRDARARSNRLLALGLTLLGAHQLLMLASILAPPTYWRLALFRAALALFAALPPAWLAFGATFAEWNGGTHLARWRPVLLAQAGLLPFAWAGLAMGWVVVPVLLGPLGPIAIGVDGWGKGFHAIVLVGFALVLLHAENLYRQADQKTRHRVKFLVVGVFTAFASQIVLISYTLLYGVFHPWHPALAAVGFLAGETCIAFSLLRHRLLQVDIFVSRYVVYRSLTLALVGGYLIALGGLAELSRWIGIGLDLVSIVLLGGVGAAGLALLLLSEQLRRRAQRFLHTHFFRHKYDYRLEWMEAVRRLSHAATIPEIAEQIGRRILEVMWVRQVAIYTMTSVPGEIALAHQSGYGGIPATLSLPSEVFAELQSMTGLLVSREKEKIPPDIPPAFAASLGNVPMGMIVPVAALDSLSGVLVVGPEISGKPFGVDDWDLLAALTAQAGALILNARLSQEAAEGRELQVLARLSAFVAHDLKNAVSTLSMLADNALVHMDKPDFRADMIRSLGDVTSRMRTLLSTLSTPGGRQASKTKIIPLAESVERWMKDLLPLAPPRITLRTKTGATSEVCVDPEQLRSVLQNLLLNAIEAIPEEGAVRVDTADEDGFAVLRVTDTGRGMSQEFLTKRLFRPFQTTKTRGLGIGLYQCRQIVQQFGGTLSADSEEGRGTTMTVRLPTVKSQQAADS